MAKKALKNTNMDTKITQSKAEMKGVIRGAMIKKRNEEVKGHHLPTFKNKLEMEGKTLEAGHNI